MKFWWLVTVFYLSCLTTSLAAQLSKERSLSSRCLPGWTYWGSHCYRFFSNFQLQWYSAERFCNQFGTIYEAGADDELAHLVSIHSDLENTFVHSLWEGVANNHHGQRQNCWIGLNDLLEEGVFQWSDQTSNDYFKWKTEQPNNRGGAQNCVALSSSARRKFGVSGTWDDGNCSLLLPFLCKMLPVYLAPPR